MDLHPGREMFRIPWPAVAVGKTLAMQDAVLADSDSEGLGLVGYDNPGTEDYFGFYLRNQLSEMR